MNISMAPITGNIASIRNRHTFGCLFPMPFVKSSRKGFPSAVMSSWKLWPRRPISAFSAAALACASGSMISFWRSAVWSCFSTTARGIVTAPMEPSSPSRRILPRSWLKTCCCARGSEPAAVRSRS